MTMAVSRRSGEWYTKLQLAQRNDSWLKPIQAKFSTLDSWSPEDYSALSRYSFKDEIVYYDNRPCIPKALRTEVLRRNHDLVLSGHQGVDRTYLKLRRVAYWPRMYADVRSNVNTCDPCQRAKAMNRAPAGLLQSLEIPARNWSSVAMDFIVQLPKSSGFDAILTAVCRKSKMVHFIPTHSTASAPATAKLFFYNVVRLHGFPDDIVSDRDSKFTATFWRE